MWVTVFCLAGVELFGRAGWLVTKVSVVGVSLRHARFLPIASSRCDRVCHTRSTVSSLLKPWGKLSVMHRDVRRRGPLTEGQVVRNSGGLTLACWVGMLAA
jgi:hypothetical protein